MFNFPWSQHLNLNKDPNWQVKSFTNILYNIICNFVPNEIKHITPRDPPWLTKTVKTLLKRKNRLYNNYKKHGYKLHDRIRLDHFREECKNAIENAKTTYYNDIGIVPG